MTKKERAAIAVERLKQLYLEATCSLEYHKEKPYELLIATRLSAQCTDARVNIVTKDLFQEYPTLQSFADADIQDIERLIHSCGFYRTKAQDIVNMSKSLIADYDSILPDTIEELTKLSGVGRKTANLIVGDIYGKPSIVTDTHCIRICGRIGLTSSKDPKKTEDELRKILDPKESGNFCHRLVHFGRETCSARSPKCMECKLNDICKEGIKKLKI
ncbi:endonuclease III [Paludicola sp. MB14-C6]|uniref:endonuclease III n=1 Tax=Paludihabitans sp. MB14-C6 TaxID=3070656 RepID=UPI0027DE1800|nr:endonuclease III [Paludicola sp. MB14-C6]WMJ22791.1 endonuclease III [Paludicola sp. MB14-C6]